MNFYVELQLQEVQMAFDRKIMCSGKDGVYAAPWMAGTCSSKTLAKYFSHHDMECVNIGKTCDRLRRALTSQNTPKCLGLSVDPKNCAVREKCLPFRVCTNICFGAIKIYQQQVNSLYKQSEDLITSIGLSDICKRSRKREASSLSDDPISKRRRLTVTETFSSNQTYSQLLDDFAQWTQQTNKQYVEMSNATTNVMPTQTLTAPRVSKFHIREITIREISATSYGLPELDDDAGFGEASVGEIAQYFETIGERDRTGLSQKSPCKRKNDDEGEPQQKICRFAHDMRVEKEHLVNTALESDFIPTPRRYPKKQELSPTTQNIVPDISSPNIKEEPYMNDSDTKPNATPPQVLRNIEKKEPSEDKEVKISKLIIDKCIKIEPEEMLQQVMAPIRITQGRVMESLRKLISKKRTPLAEVFSRSTKRTEKFLNKAKLKPAKANICQKQFQYNYEQLLRDIFTTDYSEEWATLVYPKWKYVIHETPRKKIRNKSLVNESEQILNAYGKSPAIQNFLCENSKIAANDEYNGTPQVCHWSSKMEIEQNAHEYRPYGVMKKLLQVWRYSTITKIDAVEFCHSAATEIHKAMVFSSLLCLSKDRFIEITQRPGSIYVDKILFGIASKNLIKSEPCESKTGIE